jgi:hypothetical protein
MFDYIRHHAKFILKSGKYSPKLGNNPTGGPSASSHTFIMVCGTSFDAVVPNAASAIRLGYCRAFARLGFRYRLASVLQLEKVLQEEQNPFVFLSVFDFESLSRGACKLLQNVPHFTWVNPTNASVFSVYGRYGVEPKKVRVVADYAVKCARNSGASFFWGTCTPRGFEHFGEWNNAPAPLISLPLACDDERYFPDDAPSRFAGVEMSFVGGYWPNKAIQFEKFLKPYEDRLTVYGHSPWPYKNYGGRLGESEERILYRNARLSPAISEPHVELTGDIVERVFKVAGSGGVAVVDVAPSYYKEIFSPHEILIPEDLPHYHELVRQALKDESFNERFRQSGIRAILDRHTYVHRGRLILEMLNIKAGKTPH